MANLQDYAYNTILTEILALKLTPGERIQEQSIMDHLNISRTPVREAILRLKMNNLMRTVPQSGTYVTKISLTSALNARFVRQNVEKSIVFEACDIMSAENILDCETIIDKQKLAAKNHDVDVFFNLDNDFHKSFYSISHRGEIWEWIHAISLQLNRYRYLRLKNTQLPWKLLITQHSDILAAVKNHNGPQAEKLAFDHLRLMLDEKSTLVTQFPDYFED
ncbi:GntR family transcriptional regulator [Secundilactobacillus mixtipabuli]|uniref:GntR family transcriptional regulator n=1 Tax=Secundilactobacillus mixtipabuli TaxID=1435342 RepID=A0A1Z5IET8_9LACO|nr:GntR family transcriptional regulator [Secundilactobacillus mixtipabuli]GAX00270.1 GntR family transcriptional regulator [Secundilactobacillus mixtipabuli]